MEKWADFGISAVRYDADNHYIDKIKVRKDEGDSFGPAQVWSRKDVLSLIDDQKSFVTIIKNHEVWELGQKIHIILVDNRRFLRTDANEESEDNLENLPTF